MLESGYKDYIHPFILRPQFLQFLEIWFEKSGSRNLVGEKWFCKLEFFSGPRKVVNQKNSWVYTINPPCFRLEKSGSENSDFFLVQEKWLTRKKKSEFAEPLF